METSDIIQSDYSFKVKYFQVEPEMRIRRYQYFVRMLVMSLCAFLASFSIISALQFVVLFSGGSKPLLIGASLAMFVVELVIYYFSYKIWRSLATKRCHDFGNDARMTQAIILAIFLSEVATAFMTTLRLLTSASELNSIIGKVAGIATIIAIVLGIVGYILAIILLFRPGNPGDNQYGKDPINTKVSFLG